jgi:predicted enzyme related to lactoylglutathione lyase
MTTATIEAPTSTTPANPPHDAVNWFEIPATDFNRAVLFYEGLLGVPLRRESFGEEMALFPSAPKGVGGAIVQRPSHRPAAAGVLIYLNVDGILADALARTPGLGGSVVFPITEVPGGFGSFACILDSEGNHIGLHQH